MVPIYDTDIAQERWAKSEWDRYELWEKIEVRHKRRRLIWIGVTLFIFLTLSSIPILIDRWPKWTTLGSVRKLAQEINILKREATLSHEVHRIQFVDGNSVKFIVEKSESCQGPTWQRVREGSLLKENRANSFAVVSNDEGVKLGIPGLRKSICYDPLQGASHEDNTGVAALGIIPVKDLTEGRSDRISVLLLSGPSAESTFD